MNFPHAHGLFFLVCMYVGSVGKKKKEKGGNAVQIKYVLKKKKKKKGIALLTEKESV